MDSTQQSGPSTALPSDPPVDGQAPTPPATSPDVDSRFVGPISRLLELPPADRTLCLRTFDGREIQWVVDSERPLTLHIAGPWSASEKAIADLPIDVRPNVS